MHRFTLGTALLLATATMSAQTAPPNAAAQVNSAVRRGGVSNVLPGTEDSAFTVIQGNALSATNAQLANSTVRLRDARLGHIIGSQVTDRTGLFTFRAVDPGNYVVELVGDKQEVLAASPIINVNAGDSVSTVVRLPYAIPKGGGLLGHHVAQALAVAAAAASAGVLAQSAGTPLTPVPDISPR
jgi:hypothetical protein